MLRLGRPTAALFTFENGWTNMNQGSYGAPPRAVRQSPLAASFDGASDKAGCQEHARPCPTTGAMSDTKGMHDAWITKLQRIQNTDLYTYNFYQEERMAKTMRKPQDGGQGFESFDELAGTGKVKILEGWHGTGGFPAANIYNDRQDGAFRPRMQTGLWYLTLLWPGQATQLGRLAALGQCFSQPQSCPAS